MEKNIPPYRPFYEWYEMDKDMDLAKALRDVRRAVGNQLREIAHRDGLLYVSLIYPVFSPSPTRLKATTITT